MRPSTTNSILQRIEAKEKSQKREKDVLANFFGLLKSQGKARIFRGDLNQSISALYSRDVIFSSNAAAVNTYLKNSMMYSERPALHSMQNSVQP
jgi:hypothetical protein